MAECAFADFSPDSRWLLTRVEDKTYLWDARLLVIRREIEGEARPGAFSPDGRHMVVYRPSNGEVQVIEVETGSVVNSFAARSFLTGDEPIGASGLSVPVLRFSPTGSELFIQVRPTYKYSEADDRYERMRQDATVYSVTRQAFGHRVLSHSQGEFGRGGFNARYKVNTAWGTTQAFDTVTSKVGYRTKEYVKGVYFSQDGQYALMVTGKGSQVVKLPEGEVVNQIKASRWPNDHKGYSLPCTVWVLDGGDNLLIDGVTGEIVHRLDDFAAPKFIGVSISPGGRYVAGMDHLQTLRVRDLDTGEVSTHSDERFGLRDKLIFSPDGNMLLVAVKPVTPGEREGELLDITLHRAIALGKLAVVKRLLGDPAIDVNEPDKYNRTPLWWAVRDQKTEVMDLLLARGADPLVGISFLGYAIAGGYDELATRLVEAGVDVNVRSGTSDFPLGEAASRRSVEWVKRLLDHGADPNRLETKHGRTYGPPGLNHACRQDDEPIVRLLLEHGADPDLFHKVNKRAGSVLDFAIENGHEEIARLLLEYGADPNAVTPPLVLALDRGMNGLARLLLERGADPNREAGRGVLRHRKPLQVAIDKGSVEAVRLLLEYHVAVNAKISYHTALLHTVQKGGVDIVRLLIEHGADVGYTGASGTALHIAAQKDNVDIARLLLERGIDVNAESKYGYTALDKAKEGSAVRALLLEYGAEPGGKTRR